MEPIIARSRIFHWNEQLDYHTGTWDWNVGPGFQPEMWGVVYWVLAVADKRICQDVFNYEFSVQLP